MSINKIKISEKLLKNGKSTRDAKKLSKNDKNLKKIIDKR